jgi:5'-3' exonuclease
MTDLLFADADVSAAAVAPAPPGEAGTVPTMTSPTLLAVDGNSLCHRAFHAYERSGLTRSDGAACFATYGFLTLFTGICDKVRPDGIVVGFDDATHSQRKQRWPHYKANRSPKDPSLYVQMGEVMEILGQLGVTVVVPDGLEADDVLGSAAEAARTAGWRCVIATSDRDSFALVDDNTTVLRLVSGLDNAVWMTPAQLLADYGVTGGQYRDYAAMRGDSSDNLTGVAGIGEKTAAKLLAAFGSVEAALADLDGVAAKVGKAASTRLAAGVDAWQLNRQVMEIRTDVSLDVEASRLATPEGTTAKVLRHWELPSLVSRLAVALAPAGAAPALDDATLAAMEQLAATPDGTGAAGLGGRSAPDPQFEPAPQSPATDRRPVPQPVAPGPEGPAPAHKPWEVPRPARLPLTLH